MLPGYPEKIPVQYDVKNIKKKSIQLTVSHILKTEYKIWDHNEMKIPNRYDRISCYLLKFLWSVDPSDESGNTNKYRHQRHKLKSERGDICRSLTCNKFDPLVPMKRFSYYLNVTVYQILLFRAIKLHFASVRASKNSSNQESLHRALQRRRLRAVPGFVIETSAKMAGNQI